MDGAAVAAAMLGAPDGPRGMLLAFYPDADIPPMDAVDARAPLLAARINRGCWIVSCECRSPGDPSPGMLAWLDIPLMWCIRCGNRAAGRRWRPYARPSDDERAAIEAALETRAVGHRNWSPGETVADLLADNAAHGQGV